MIDLSLSLRDFPSLFFPAFSPTILNSYHTWQLIFFEGKKCWEVFFFFFWELFWQP